MIDLYYFIAGGTGAPVVNYFEAPPISPISPILTNHVASNGPKKVVENDMVSNMFTISNLIKLHFTPTDSVK